MHDDKLDVLTVGVVFVVDGEKSIDQEKFGECVGAEVTIAQDIVLPASPTPAALGPTTVSYLTLDRERITVELRPERLQVTKPELPISSCLDPSNAPSSTRAIVVSLTDAVNHPIELTKPSLGVVS